MPIAYIRTVNDGEQMSSNGVIMGAERRYAPRLNIDTVEVIEIVDLDSTDTVASKGVLIDASSSGFLIHIDRRDLVNQNYRESLSLDAIIGKTLSVEIENMKLDVIGQVIRTRRIGTSIFELAIDYSEDAPQYWRECLLDLLPKSGEL